MFITLNAYIFKELKNPRRARSPLLKPSRVHRISNEPARAARADPSPESSPEPRRDLVGGYSAGEPKLPDVEAAGLADAIRARGHRDVRFLPDLERVPAELAPELREGDLVLTLGAGSVGRLGPKLLEALREDAR